MLGQVKKVIMLIKDGKSVLLLLALYNYIPVWLFRYYKVFVGYSDGIPDDMYTDKLEKISKRYEYRFASLEDLELIYDLYEGHKQNMDNVRPRFERGDVCAIALYRQKCVAVLWLRNSEEHYENKLFCRFKLPDNTAWLYDTYVAKKFRSRGVYMALANWTYQYCHFSRYYGFMVNTNMASIRSHDRLGSKLVYEIHFISILGYQKFTVWDLTRNSTVDQKFVTFGHTKPPLINLTKHKKV